MYTFNNAVNDNYNTIALTLKQHHIYNADVFHDTIMKCYNIWADREIHKENVEKYFITAYKQNLVRDKMYCRNAKSTAVTQDESDVVDNKYLSHIDYFRIKKYVIGKYGDTLCNLLKRYNLGGYSVKELEEESGISGLAYKFKKMETDIRETFNELLEC